MNQKISRRNRVGVLSFLTLTISFVASEACFAGSVAPDISITSPLDGFATNQDSLQLTVQFRASANPTGKTTKPTGNVKTVILKLNGTEVARHDNPPNIKEGTHTFEVDLSGHPEGTISLQAFAYQGNVNAGHVGESETISLIIDRTSPVISNLQPPDGGISPSLQPMISADFSDNLSGVNPTSAHISLNGSNVTPDAEISSDGLTFTPTAPIPTGENVVIISVSDLAGNQQTVMSSFTTSSGFRAIADCAPTSGSSPLTVRFRSRGEFEGGSIVRYRWDFQGDGVFDTSDAVARDYTRTFTQSGTFDAVLQVTNNLGETATDTCTISVENSPPTVVSNAVPSNGEVPLTVNLSCVGSDTDGSIVLFEWDFDGDGTFDFSSPTSGNTTHTYTETGTFTATCRVTDNEGLTAQARTSTTVIRPGPPGSPSVEATVSPSSGNAPLQVSFNGSATDDGSVVQWEWDFEGDGTFDFSSASSPVTTFTYTNAGIFAAALRVTDNDGLTSTDNVEVIVNITASLSVADDTFDPTNGETAAINTTINAPSPVRLLLKDQNGAVIRTLVDETRPAGSYSDEWDGRNDGGELVPQDPYYAILEFEFAGEPRVIDLTNTTGGLRYNPARTRLPRSFKPFENDILTINFTVPSNRGASEVQAFFGLFFTDTRFITLLDRVPLGVGTHTVRWDGLDANGNFAVPPPGDSFLFGIWGFTLPDNAIFVQSAPVISNVTVIPNFFDPSTGDFLSPNTPTATVTYSLDKRADVELTVTNLKTGVVLRRIIQTDVSPGTGLQIQWDGLADSGLFADKGDYRLALQATDSAGGQSLIRFALIRVFY